VKHGVLHALGVAERERERERDYRAPGKWGRGKVKYPEKTLLFIIFTVMCLNRTIRA
jgi:hypothetical protein